LRRWKLFRRRFYIPKALHGFAFWTARHCNAIHKDE